MDFTLRDFLEESNRIEGITRPEMTAEGEFRAAEAFLALDKITVPDLEKLVAVFQPGAALRDQVGLDVRVADHRPPKGGPHIRGQLEDILNWLENPVVGEPYSLHRDYEILHPFSDGNGRSGRMLWLWQMEKFHGGAPLGFLHTWYYQSLGESA